VVGAAALVGLVHAALVAPRYHVGSFDDDASYILAAKALLAGHGLGWHLTNGETLAGLYAPGYPALLAPLLWLWPHSYLPLRLLSAACFAGLFPLTWAFLRAKGCSPRVAGVALFLMAASPVPATFATMVMAETPFLVVLVATLIALDRWRAAEQWLGQAGISAVVGAAALVWLKEAGLGLVAGACLWLAWSPGPRRWAKAAALAGGVGLTLLPVALSRLLSGIPLAGDRYAEELNGYYQGGLVDRLVHVLPHSTWHLLATALPATLVPYLGPLPITHHWPDLWKALSWLVTLLVVVGAVAWWRRHRDAAVPMVAVYAVESVLWPFVNERRAILVLPLLVAWWAMGAAAVWRLAGRSGGPARRVARPSLVAGALAVVVVPLVLQAPRDYLFGWNQSSSQPEGSRYMAVLAALPPSSGVVETDYRSATALFSGHPTQWNAFFNSTVICYEPAVRAELVADRADFLLLGDLNKPGLIDSPCLAGLVAGSDWAVPLAHTARDSASVWELVGPGTAQPGLADLLASASPALLSSRPGADTWTWTWPAPVTLSQFSVGEAAATGATASVSLEVQAPGGAWTTVASTPGAVGDGRGSKPILLASGLDQPAVAVRVVVTGTDTGGRAAPVRDVGVIGPAG
jgi:hypothetical protein